MRVTLSRGTSFVTTASSTETKFFQKGTQIMLTRSRKALETIEWIGIGVVLIIIAVLAYRVLGAQIVGWIQSVAAAIG
jgi:hypothetical protein